VSYLLSVHTVEVMSASRKVFHLRNYDTNLALDAYNVKLMKEFKFGPY
jgi:hypothetical protein